MQQGFDIQTAESAFDAVNAIRALEEAVKNCGFEQSLIVLVKMRASQINGCACRIHSHIRNARLHGVTEERLRVLHAWRDPAMPFSARERAALAWTEALTVLSTRHVADAIHQQAREQFDRDELAKLTLLVGTTNLWDRIAIGFRSVLHAAGETCSDARSTGRTCSATISPVDVRYAATAKTARAKSYMKIGMDRMSDHCPTFSSNEKGDQP